MFAFIKQVLRFTKPIIPRPIRKTIRILAFRLGVLRTDDRNIPVLVPYNVKGTLTAMHISAFSNGNAGDTLLPVVLRDLFNDYIGVKKWNDKDVSREIKESDIWFMNRNDFIVIGGGGLFLRDTYPNNVSGWQWNCSINNMIKIEKPLIAFAIGYNRFRGQDEFKPIFTDHINAFVKKASFVGLRNHGSIERIKSYLKDESLKEKVVFQPCMTTLISRIYPQYTNYVHKENFIALNCAFDRQSLRSSNDECLKKIAIVIFKLSKIAPIKYYSHMQTDNNMLHYLDNAGVPYELVELKDVNSIIDNYSKPRLVIGMRGHSQMIPFGCLTPILSIVSHDKMQWFLDDITHPEWGVDVLDDNFEENLYKKARLLYFNTENVISMIKQSQNYLWDITLKNMEAIKDIITTNTLL